MTFDKLTYIDRLKAAGFAEPRARAMADGLDQALREEVATKSDLAVLRAEFKSDLGVLKGELLAAMKADKIDFLKWVEMLIVGQTAVHRVETSRSLARQSRLPSRGARCEWLALSPSPRLPVSTDRTLCDGCTSPRRLAIAALSRERQSLRNSAFCDLSKLEVIPFGF